MEACRLYSKFSARPSNLEVIPSVVEKVVDGLIVVFLSSLQLDYKNWEMQIVFICLFCPKAVRCSMYGRPGACYVDIAGDMVNAKVDRSKVRLGDLFFSVWYLVCHCRCVLPLPKSVFVPQGSVLLPTSTLECS